MILESIEKKAEWVRRLPGLQKFGGLWDFLRPSYDAFLQLATRGNGIELSMPGGVDRFLFDLAFRNFNFASSETDVYAWFSRELRPGMVFYDLGAFLGHYSLCAAKRVGPSGHVVAFEPTNSTFNCLQRHIRLNRFEERIQAYNCLVGDDDSAEVDFFIQGEGVQASNGIAFRRDVEYVDRAKLLKTSKRMRSVDNLVLETSVVPDVIKIDVEGAEERVLRGAETTLRRYRPRIVCSIHPFWLPGLNDSTESLIAFIHSLNYRAFDFKGNEKDHFGFEEVLLLPE